MKQEEKSIRCVCFRRLLSVPVWMARDTAPDMGMRIAWPDCEKRDAAKHAKAATPRLPTECESAIAALHRWTDARASMRLSAIGEQAGCSCCL